MSDVNSEVSDFSPRARMEQDALDEYEYEAASVYVDDVHQLVSAEQQGESQEEEVGRSTKEVGVQTSSPPPLVIPDPPAIPPPALSPAPVTVWHMKQLPGFTGLPGLIGFTSLTVAKEYGLDSTTPWPLSPATKIILARYSRFQTRCEKLGLLHKSEVCLYFGQTVFTASLYLGAIFPPSTIIFAK